MVYWKEPGRIKVRTVLVNDIPRFGRGPEDCFVQNKSVLRVAGGLSLRQAFQRCHDYIYAHRGGSNETIFWEFLKIVFAKIQDERNLQQAHADGQEGQRQFRIASLEERNDETKAEQVKARLDNLYHQVRAQYPELFGAVLYAIRDLWPHLGRQVVRDAGAAACARVSVLGAARALDMLRNLALDLDDESQAAATLLVHHLGDLIGPPVAGMVGLVRGALGR